MRAIALVALAVLLVAAAPIAPALHTGCVPSTSAATLMLGSGARNSDTVYIAMDPGEATVPLPWIYMETNGRDGLQRHDDWRDDTCGGEYSGDMLVF